MSTYTPYVCMQTNSTCYKQESRKIVIKGVLWHSTGANNPYLKRYVQPTDNSENYDKDIKKIGKNTNGNDWNHISVEAGLNAWIGKFADGTIGTVQTMPWDHRPWGCGSGSKGSCNNGWIQFEICEDSLKDKNYAEKVYNEACQLTAYLCKKFNIDPNGASTLNGVTVPNITCHNDAAKLNLASNHSDINHWFPKILGKDMTDVRKDVSAILNNNKLSSSNSSSVTSQKTEIVTTYTGIFPNQTLKKGNTGTQVKYLQTFLNWYGGYQLDIDGSFGAVTETAVKDFQKNESLAVDGSFGPASLAAAKKAKKKNTVTSTFKSYKVKVTANALKVRQGPGMNYTQVSTIFKNEVYTIVDEKSDGTYIWGKLKSGIGYICLYYTDKII